MLDFLKDSIQLTNFFLFAVALLAFTTYHYSFKKICFYWSILLLLFLAASTNILPTYLVAHYEAKTPICNPTILDKNETYYLHVLGAGYSLDSRLPATSQLSNTTLARLIEAIRISKPLPNYKIVTSGNSRLNLESQAEVARRAAIELGIPSENCDVLTTPTTTAEEVKAFVAKFGTNKKVIVVSDAMHLPRAIMLYKRAGIIAIGAPTNFQVKMGVNDYNGISFPSMGSINLMNNYLRERLKYWKDSL
ncbi:uncharacterized SAM-binding protein YcdF (DUF218 family) [Flavobacterium sp. PL11]|uniref:YdcF family protein n=1 Tax=Flavobacterium sp. PL11 TaxID=3071717 RepID=UPI002DFEC54F|nr:uncharacterized SAM-binding protein YcdF (DUF218 family) [Flavobacterium sp. PL11]